MAYLRKIINMKPSDYDCVAPGRHMKGNVVDAYLRILERRSTCSDTLPSVFAFDHLFFNAWDIGGYTVIPGKAQERDIFEKDLLLFPSLIKKHWALILVDVRKHLIHCFDPLCNPHYSRMEKVLDFLCAEARKKNVTFRREAWMCVRQSENCPKRENETDSGVYVCVFAEKLTRDKSLFKRVIDVLAACKAVSKALRRKKIDVEDFSPREPLPFERFGEVYSKFSQEDESVQQQTNPKFIFKKNYFKKFSRRLVPDFQAQPRDQSSSTELPEDVIQLIHSISNSESLEPDHEASVQEENPKKRDFEIPVSISESTAVKRKNETAGLDENKERKKRASIALRSTEARSEESDESLEPVLQRYNASYLIIIIPQETPRGV